MEEDSKFKEYLKPNYSEEPPYDSSPTEDDDDDDDINDIDEGEEDKKVEKVMEDQKKLNEKIMQQTPFGQSVGGNSGGSWNQQPAQSPWNNNNNNQSGNSWGGGNNNQSPWTPRPATGSSWGSTGGSSGSWGSSGSSSGWGGSSGSSWGGGNNNSGKREIDRQKQVIFCDVLDCLVETFQSNGKPGLLPRGIYDIRLRFEVWDKILCFNPSKVYAMVPRNLILSSNGSDSWKIMLEYIVCALSEYLRVPYDHCQILVQKNFSQTKDNLMNSVIQRIPDFNKSLAIQIGLESGLYGQSNRDILAAEKVGIDYVDLGQLLSIYL